MRGKDERKGWEGRTGGKDGGREKEERGRVGVRGKGRGCERQRKASDSAG